MLTYSHTGLSLLQESWYNLIVVSRGLVIYCFSGNHWLPLHVIPAYLVSCHSWNLSTLHLDSDKSLWKRTVCFSEACNWRCNWERRVIFEIWIMQSFGTWSFFFFFTSKRSVSFVLIFVSLKRKGWWGVGEVLVGIVKS